MNSKRTTGLLAAVLALAAIALHSLTLHSPPLFDDKLLLTANQIFTDYSVPFTIWQRWLSYGTFAWTYQLFGENWPVFRAENVLLHAATAIALMYFYKKLFQKLELPEGPAIYLAAAGALLFAVHPAGVYAVSYLIQRSIVMATLFSILALMALLKAFENGQRRWLAMAVVAYVLALSSKEHALMLPLVAGAMVYLLNRHKSDLPLRRSLMYSVLLFLAALATVAGIYHELIAAPFDEASRNLVKRMGENYPAVAAHPYLLSVFNEAYLFFKYLALWLLPVPSWLSVDMRQPFPTSLTAWPQVLGPALYVLYGIGAYYFLKKGGNKGLLGFGLIVPWLLYPTEFSTVWIQDPFVMYRGYFWLIGLPALLPWVYSKFGARAVMAIVGVLAIVFTWASIIKLDTFKTEYALWNDAVRYNNDRVDDPTAQGRERAYNERALLNAQSGKIAEALADYNEAIGINPRDPALYTNRAALRVLLSQDDEAAKDLGKALSLDPNYPQALYNRAAMHARAGKEDLAMQELDAILARPETETADARIARATLLLKRQQFDKAIQDYSRALKMQSGNANVYASLAGAKAAVGDWQGALEAFGQVVALNPGSIEARTNRALVLLQLGKKQEALADADAAVAIDPNLARPHLVRAQIYITLNRVDDAIAEYDRILEKNPNEAMAHLNRGEVAMAMGRLQAARTDIDAACKLGLKPACAKLAAMPR